MFQIYLIKAHVCTELGLQGLEISRFSAAKGEKPAPLCLSAIFGKIDEKSRNPVQAFQSNYLIGRHLPLHFEELLISTVEERWRGGVGDADVGRRARVRVPAVRPAAPPAHARTFKPPPGQPLRQVWRQVWLEIEFE